jgi:hypothetical protein
VGAEGAACGEARHEPPPLGAEGAGLPTEGVARHEPLGAARPGLFWPELGAARQPLLFGAVAGGAFEGEARQPLLLAGAFDGAARHPLDAPPAWFEGDARHPAPFRGGRP